MVALKPERADGSIEYFDGSRNAVVALKLGYANSQARHCHYEAGTPWWH